MDVASRFSRSAASARGHVSIFHATSRDQLGNTYEADSVGHRFGGFESVGFQAHWNDDGDSCGTLSLGFEEGEAIRPLTCIHWTMDIMVFPLSQRRDAESQLKSERPSDGRGSIQPLPSRTRTTTVLRFKPTPSGMGCLWSDRLRSPCSRVLADLSKRPFEVEGSGNGGRAPLLLSHLRPARAVETRPSR